MINFYKKFVTKNKYLLETVSALILTLVYFVTLAKFSADEETYNRCKALVNDGWWINNSDLVWQPKGCILKSYYHDGDINYPHQNENTKQQIAHCYRDQVIVFLGDNHIKDKFDSFVNSIGLIDNKDKSGVVVSDFQNGQRYELVDKRISIVYFMDEFLNGRDLQIILDSYKNQASLIEDRRRGVQANSNIDPVNANDIKIKWTDSNGNTYLDVPSLLVLGGGQKMLLSTDNIDEGNNKNNDDNDNDNDGKTKNSASLEHWMEKSIKSIVSSIVNVNQHVYISPIPPIVVEKLEGAKYQHYKEDYEYGVNWMNQHIERLIKIHKSSIIFPTSWSKMLKHRPGHSTDGISYSKDITNKMVELIHNRMCNKMNGLESTGDTRKGNENVVGSNSSSVSYCCTNYHSSPPGVLVWMVFFSLIVLIPILLFLLKIEKILTKRGRRNSHLADFVNRYSSTYRSLFSMHFQRARRGKTRRSFLIRVYLLGAIIALGIANEKSPLFDKISRTNYPQLKYTLLLIMLLVSLMCVSTRCKLAKPAGKYSDSQMYNMADTHYDIQHTSIHHQIHNHNEKLRKQTTIPLKYRLILNSTLISEWRGWVTLILIIQNYTSAKPINSISFIELFLNSCLIFLTAFDVTTRFLSYSLNNYMYNNSGNVLNPAASPTPISTLLKSQLFRYNLATVVMLVILDFDLSLPNLIYYSVSHSMIIFCSCITTKLLSRRAYPVFSRIFTCIIIIWLGLLLIIPIISKLLQNNIFWYYSLVVDSTVGCLGILLAFSLYTYLGFSNNSGGFENSTSNDSDIPSFENIKNSSNMGYKLLASPTGLGGLVLKLVVLVSGVILLLYYCFYCYSTLLKINLAKDNRGGNDISTVKLLFNTTFLVSLLYSVRIGLFNISPVRKQSKEEKALDTSNSQTPLYFYYSIILTKVGKYWLELLVCQFIFLTSNTNSSLLVFSPLYNYFDATTPIATSYQTLFSSAFNFVVVFVVYFAISKYLFQIVNRD